MKINDKSNGSEGSIQQLGVNHLATSSPAAHLGRNSASVGDGKISQNPEIPDSTSVENATVEGEPVIYSAAHEAEEAAGGVQASLVHQGVTAIGKTATARPDQMTKTFGGTVHDAGRHVEEHKSAMSPAREQFEWSNHSAANTSLMPDQDSPGVALALDRVTKSATQPATLVISRQGFNANQVRPSSNRSLSMSEVQDRKRHPEKYVPIVDAATDSGLPVKQSKPVVTGPAVSNPGENSGRLGAV